MDIGYLISFTAGILSVISPCVVPLIPIVVGHSLLKRNNIEILAFITGFFLVFVILSLFTVMFTVAINHYLLYFRAVAAILIIIMGIIFLFNKNIFKFSYNLKYRNNVVESLIVGVLTCIAWSPCYGPYIVAVAAYSASTGNWLYSALNMTLFSAGFSVSIFALAFLTSKLNLKILLKHYDSIRIFSGIIIIIAGIYLLSGYL